MNRSILLLLVGALLSPDVARADGAADRVLALVVDRDNPKSDITLAEIKEIFLGKRKEWADGARIIALDLEPGPARDGFSKSALGMDQAAVDQFWVEQKVRGTGSPPKAVSAATAAKLVPKVRGAISYIPLSAVDATLKVLTVGGVLPDKAGYPVTSR